MAPFEMDPEEPSGYWDYFYNTSQNPAIWNNFHVSYTTILLPILYGAMFLVGVWGNLALMGALHFKRSNGRLIDIFIFNLAASDFIFLVTLPLWVDKEASEGQWRTGSFLCKGSSYVISVNMHSSVFLLTCMSVDRYLAIIFPATSRKFRRECAYKVCVCIWIISCLLGLPILLSRELTFIDDKPYCAEMKPSFIKLTWSLVALIFTFFAPLVSILTCYCCIMRKLFVHYQQSGRHNKKLRKSMKIILIVVAAFVFSWLPFNTFKLLSIILGLHQKQEQEPNFTLHFLKQAVAVSRPLAFANSCVNPFIYCIFDSYIRRAIVRCLYSCLKKYDFGSSTETSDTHFSHVFSNHVYSEDLVRRRRRSRSL